MKPQSVDPERLSFYIDGFNFYYGLMQKGWARYRWLDFRALAELFTLDHQSITTVRYFTSRLTAPADACERQAVYLQALSRHGGLDIIEGTMEQRELKCPHCEKRFKRSQEKHTDVNIATAILVDCFDDAMDTMVVVSADADMLPAIRVAKERFGKRLILVDPPRRHSDALAAVSDQHLHVSRQALTKCLLPNPVVWTRKGKQREVWMPPTWS